MALRNMNKKYDDMFSEVEELLLDDVTSGPIRLNLAHEGMS
jgi:hypothetical protein